jgi:hypothetical protein
MINLIDIEDCRAHEKAKSKDLIEALVGAVANLLESQDPISLGDEEDRFPVWGSIHAGGASDRPNPP